MKKTLHLGLIFLFALIFCGTANADPDNSQELLAKADASLDGQQSLDVQCNGQDKDNIDEVVKKKTGEKSWEEPRYCRPLFEFWCHQICQDVSPSKPGGNNNWGKKCTRRLMSKCERCDFLP